MFKPSKNPLREIELLAACDPFIYRLWRQYENGRLSLENMTLALVSARINPKRSKLRAYHAQVQIDICLVCENQVKGVPILSKPKKHLMRWHECRQCGHMWTSDRHYQMLVSSVFGLVKN